MATDENQKAVSVNDAVKTATNHLYAWLPGVEDVLLEEVELSDDDRYWLVTLSCFQYLPNELRPAGITPSPTYLLKAGKQRAYKVFKIDRQTGEVRSMKIRELQNA